MEKRVAELIGKDAKLKGKFDKILAIKGLGLQTLAIIVAETNGFAAFESASQLVSYAGYDVVENESGNRKGKTKISKKGTAHIRRAMFFPAFNMCRYDVGDMLVFYERIFERTRQKMKGYVAIQKKLLTIIYALRKKDEAFDPDYERPAVKKKSGDTGAVPSVATAVEAKAKEHPQKEVIPANETGITQDRHPSKPRRTPSLAASKLTEKYLT
jgi:hypothetical protein